MDPDPDHRDPTGSGTLAPSLPSPPSACSFPEAKPEIAL